MSAGDGWRREKFRELFGANKGWNSPKNLASKANVEQSHCVGDGPKVELDKAPFLDAKVVKSTTPSSQSHQEIQWEGLWYVTCCVGSGCTQSTMPQKLSSCWKSDVVEGSLLRLL